ncbi:MAG TPA: aminotransferase class V-fold PLP-dependent enzyme, partial [Candidatus Saccharimonadales bacterium]|nr:aminotransferase class V-fold PLP-dependent enzyme [Candidatus Saccharimonadales bacterium]
LEPLSPPLRLLLGPGPSEVAPEVLEALSRPLIGHLDPAFLKLMDGIMEGLRVLFRTRNRLTLPISGTGSAGMETAISNLVEADDRVVVAICGYFGARMAEMCRRRGAKIVTVEAPWGGPVDPADVVRAVAAGPTKAVCIVHAETSTGVLQPLEGIADAVHEAGGFLIADTVTSLGGVPLDVDATGIDAAYSGSQKCLSAPPGASPFTISERAMEAVRTRRTPVPFWYLDLTLLNRYFDAGDRVYHHTAPISNFYALHEAIRLALDEGLEARWRRHAAAGAALAEGAAALGLDLLVDPRWRLGVLTTIKVPAGVDEKEIRRRLLAEEGIEIAGGLGPLAGKVWRVGLMGHGARIENVERLLAALRRLL